jgi:succinate dehydrogenase hydrophobic anchor subunit
MRVFQLQRISAVGLLVFLTMHMIVVHYPPFHIDFSRIAERMSQPLWQAIDIAFLFFVLVHALTGLYAVLMDWDVTARLQRPAVGLLLGAGAVAMWWGTLTILSFSG